MYGIGCQVFDDPHDVVLAGEYLPSRNSGSINSERRRPPKRLRDRKYPFVHIHKLKNSNGEQSAKGRNPFDDFTMKRDGAKLSTIVKTYDSQGATSTDAYDYITTNLSQWVEEAVSIRNAY